MMLLLDFGGHGGGVRTIPTIEMQKSPKRRKLKLAFR